MLSSDSNYFVGVSSDQSLASFLWENLSYPPLVNRIKYSNLQLRYLNQNKNWLFHPKSDISLIFLYVEIPENVFIKTAF